MFLSWLLFIVLVVTIAWFGLCVRLLVHNLNRRITRLEEQWLSAHVTRESE